MRTDLEDGRYWFLYPLELVVRNSGWGLGGTRQPTGDNQVGFEKRGGCNIPNTVHNGVFSGSLCCLENGRRQAGDKPAEGGDGWISFLGQSSLSGVRRRLHLGVIRSVERNHAASHIREVISGFARAGHDDAGLDARI